MFRFSNFTVSTIFQKKNMVLDAVLQKKDMVLDAVSKTFVIRKKSRIQYSSDFGFRHTMLHSGASVQFGRW